MIENYGNDERGNKKVKIIGNLIKIIEKRSKEK